MTIDPSGFYPVIAQIAAAFAGFGSLAGGLGRVDRADDTRIDAFRLATMLFASLSATLLGLLPGTLQGIGLGAATAVRLSAFAAIAAIAVYVPMGLRRVTRIRGVVGFSRLGGAANGLSLALAFGGFVACASGVWSGLTEGLYLLGLFALLCSSVVMFWRVISSMLRPSHGS